MVYGWVSTEVMVVCGWVSKRVMVVYGWVSTENIEKHLLPQFVNTIQVICLQDVYKINYYF